MIKLRVYVHDPTNVLNDTMTCSLFSEINIKEGQSRLTYVAFIIIYIYDSLLPQNTTGFSTDIASPNDAVTMLLRITCTHNNINALVAVLDRAHSSSRCIGAGDIV